MTRVTPPVTPPLTYLASTSILIAIATARAREEKDAAQEDTESEGEEEGASEAEGVDVLAMDESASAQPNLLRALQTGSKREPTASEQLALESLPGAPRTGGGRQPRAAPRAPEFDPNCPNLIRKDALARKKGLLLERARQGAGEARIEYAVPQTQRQLQKKQRKEEARQLALTQRVYDDDAPLPDAAGDA
eukprot:CAMPEP_0180027496 /NCGR_PEP_ID=MMETSP0984-20121128/25772_1 /TAXON_ID=483367 /ORGANISM="non described non described, Strain CCMP 2436" /LENGTH=190 /DNA_ID=CAMNT_0021952303 /DNA_START=417 /DNA_END=990 /DNA_ORIENTATION=+